METITPHYKNYYTMILKKQIYLKEFLKTFNYKTSTAGLPGELESRSSNHSEIPTGARSRSEELADIWLAKQVRVTQVFQASLRMTTHP